MTLHVPSCAWYEKPIVAAAFGLAISSALAHDQEEVSVLAVASTVTESQGLRVTLVQHYMPTLRSLRRLARRSSKRHDFSRSAL